MTQTASVPEIIIDSWPEQRIPQQELQASLTYLAHKVGKPVRLQQYTAQPHFTDRMVVLYICTRDTCPNGHATPTLLLDGTEYELADTQPFFQVDSLPGTPITDDQGAVEAKVLHNCITVLVEFTGEDNQTARALLAYVVEKAVELLDFEVEPVQTERERAVREQFDTWLRRCVRSLLEEKKYELSRLESDIERGYHQIIEGERKRPVLEGEIDNLAKLQRVPHPRLARTQAAQLLELLDRGVYEEVTWNDAGVLLATTGPVVIEHEGWRFALGRYEVTIEPTGRLNIKNLTEHPRAEHPHPHVGSDGTPCLGNVRADMAKLIGRMRIADALQVLHTFLCSYNRDGAYESIAHFDPTGEYADPNDDPCQDCDERCSPYCINRCEHNDAFYGCGDCYDYRTSFCYEECEYNEGYELVHPCNGCDQSSTDYCSLECPYNEDWQLQTPCDNCVNPECTGRCPYRKKHGDLEGR